MVNNHVHNELGKLRRSMVVQTFGPGSIVDFRADGAPVSAVMAGLEEWDHSFPLRSQDGSQMAFEPRLQQKLGGLIGFRLPPVVTEGPDREGRYDTRSLVAVRFPTWLQCPKCDRLAPAIKWDYDPRYAYRYCSRCTEHTPGRRRVPVIPVRFVMACPAGHLDEFPWDWWVKHKTGCKNRGNLLLKSERPGLSGLIVRCPVCGASKSLEGIFSAAIWRGFKCNGRRPWLRSGEDTCDLQPRVLQRGASNLYFPILESALSIPPWSDRLQDALGLLWSSLVNIKDTAQRAIFISILAENQLKQTLEDLHLSPKELADMIEVRINRCIRDDKPDIKQEEYRQFMEGGDTEPEEGSEFETRDVEIPDYLRPYFNKIVRVIRLREVRAIRGFTRINPPDDENNQNNHNIAPISVERLNWLPAIEVYGEGIFLALDRARLRKWEEHKEVQSRAARIQEGWQKEWITRYNERNTSPIITPRYLLVHTFAHALMRQLTLECGYSSASLRERLYIGEDSKDMAGLLIYTATSDSDGTLGGLQRQGEPERILPAVQAAIRAMEWCSSDPLCIEGMVAAPENHSFASCHACCLAPETSCEQYNRFLDRASLVGRPGNQEIGFFSPMITGDD